MSFVPSADKDRARMLEVVGVKSADQLFEVVPEQFRLRHGLALPPASTEIELEAELRDCGIADHAAAEVCFAGAGCYDHFIPAVVDSVISKPEFFTAYTPYQPEVSQGTLQAIYEFQTMVCELTGMDVANASMYDGATAMVEAAYLASHFTKRSKVVVSAGLHPEWLATLRTYASAGLLDIVEVPMADGATDASALAPLCDDAACVVVASPNFYGNFEDLPSAGEAAKAAGALFVVVTNPILLGVTAPPSESGADVVVGEGQPLGNPMSFGGPGLGLFACREEYLRRMPGRIVGATVDEDANRGFVLTMQAREQHIRRERATSNICSNHSLNALAAAVYLAAVGPEGLAEVGRACLAKARYMREALVRTGKFERAFAAPHSHEFALRYKGDVGSMRLKMRNAGFMAGVDLARFSEEDTGLVLFAVTEKRTRAEMDAFVEEVEAL